jgi:hypothetical protein
MTTTAAEYKLRLAHLDDIAALEQLIVASVRGLQKKEYTQTQIEASLSAAYGVDQQLIEDGTYFVATSSVITLNPAIRDRVKSGHREWQKT